MGSAYDEDELTDKQTAILKFIGKEVVTGGVPPTLREICARFGLSSTKGVHDHLEALRRKGCLTKEPGKMRSLVLTAKGRIICGLSRLKNRDQLEHAASLALDALGFVGPALRAAGKLEAIDRVTRATAALREAGVE